MTKTHVWLRKTALALSPNQLFPCRSPSLRILSIHFHPSTLSVSRYRPPNIPKSPSENMSTSRLALLGICRIKHQLAPLCSLHIRQAHGHCHALEANGASMK